MACERAKKRKADCRVERCNLRDHSQRKNTIMHITCPVCTISVRGDKALKSHYLMEIKRMRKPFENMESKRKFYRMKLRSSNAEQEEESSHSNEITDLETRVTDLKDIKKRKFNRYANMFLLSKQNNHNKPSSSSSQTDESAQYNLISCSVCNEFLELSNEKTTKHLAKCFAKRDYEYNLYSSSDEEEEETVEEFSWAGQTWIRTSSLVDSDLLRREGRLMRMEMEDGDEELDVDGGDWFGEQQFAETDVIPCTSNSAGKKTRVLRAPVTEGPSCGNQYSNSTSHSNDALQQASEESIKMLEEKSAGDSKKFIDSLKHKIIQMEERLDIEVSKCSICMNPYTDPVVSTGCWHVCCSECWMRTLGAKKLCPKCNNIVAPSQLRKIYL